MLVLTRKPGEVVCIGDEITVTIVQVRGLEVRLGINAPAGVPIVRPDAKSKESKPERWQP